MPRRSNTPDRLEAPAHVLQMTEAQWQALVVEAAQLFGWVVIHVRNMIANQPGIPDLLLFRDERFVLTELKTESGKVSAKQEMWHARAADAGVTVQVWRPSDWPTVQEVLR